MKSSGVDVGGGMSDVRNSDSDKPLQSLRLVLVSIWITAVVGVASGVGGGMSAVLGILILLNYMYMYVP